MAGLAGGQRVAPIPDRGRDPDCYGDAEHGGGHPRWHGAGPDQPVPEGQPVEIGEVQKGLDKLQMHASVRVNVDELGHRSAFVGAVLATLPGAQYTHNPATVTLTAPAASK